MWLKYRPINLNKGSILPKYISFSIEVDKKQILYYFLTQYISRVVKYNKKSLDSIFHAYLTRKGTAKICKKFNSHDGFLRADQGIAKNCCQIGWIGCPILQVAQKPPWDFNFLHIFAIPSSSGPHQVDMKNIVKWRKDFLLYFTTLETYRVKRRIETVFRRFVNLSIQNIRLHFSAFFLQMADLFIG